MNVIELQQAFEEALARAGVSGRAKVSEGDNSDAIFLVETESPYSKVGVSLDVGMIERNGPRESANIVVSRAVEWRLRWTPAPTPHPLQKHFEDALELLGLKGRAEVFDRDGDPTFIFRREGDGAGSEITVCGRLSEARTPHDLIAIAVGKFAHCCELADERSRPL